MDDGALFLKFVIFHKMKVAKHTLDPKSGNRNWQLIYPNCSVLPKVAMAWKMGGGDGEYSKTFLPKDF